MIVERVSRRKCSVLYSAQFCTDRVKLFQINQYISIKHNYIYHVYDIHIIHNKNVTDVQYNDV